MDKRPVARWLRTSVEFVAALILVISIHGAAIRSVERVVDRFDPFANKAPVVLEISEQVYAGEQGSGRPPAKLMPGHEATVATEEIQVLGFMAPEAHVQVFVNDVFDGDWYASENGTFRTTLFLRPGVNNIVARVPGSAPPKDDPLQTSHGTADFRVSRGSQKLGVPPLFLVSRRSEFQQLHLYGLAAPFASLHVCRAGDGKLPERVTADEIGVFAVPVSSADELVWLKEAPATEPAGDSSCPSDESYEFSAARYEADGFLSRELQVTMDEQDIMKLRAVVRLPRGSELEYMAKIRVLGAREFIERVFNVDLDRRNFWDPRVPLIPQHEANVVQVHEIGGIGGMAELRAEVDDSQVTLQIRDWGRQRSALPAFMNVPGDSLHFEVPVRSSLMFSSPPDSDQLTESAALRSMKWTQPVKSGMFTATLRSQATQSPETEAGVNQRLSDVREGQISPIRAINLIRELLPEMIDTLGFYAIAAIPYIWFLLILRDFRSTIRPDDWRRLHYIVVGFLVLHASYVLVFFPGVDLHGWVRRFLTSAPSEDASTLINELRDVLPRYFPAMLVLGIGVFWLVERLYDPDEFREFKAGRTWRVVRALVLWPLLVILMVLPLILSFVPVADLLEELGGATHAEAIQFVAIAVAALFGALAMRWLLRIVFRSRVPFRYALILSAAVILVPLAPSIVRAGVAASRSAMFANDFNPFLLATDYVRVAWIVVVLAVGVALSSAVLTRAMALGNVKLLPAWSSKMRGLAIAGFFAVVAFPASVMLGSYPDDRLLVTFVGRVLWLLPLVALVAVLVFLRKSNPTDRFELSEGERAAGALVFAFYLCGETTNLLLVPIPLLLGYHLYRHRLLIGPNDLKSAHPGFDKSTALAALIKLKNAEHLRRAFRRNAEKKYTEGEMTRDAFEDGLVTADKHVADAQAALPMGEEELREQIFARGPGTGPWDNARKAVLYGIPVGVLLLVASIERAFRPRDTDPFPILGVVQPILVVTAYLATMAFVFGYFYHAIRGRNGPAKGVRYAACIMLPTLVILILNAQSILGLTSGERLLRIALFVAALALAFDWQVVRSAGFRLRHLILIYGGAPSLAIGSSIAALGGLSLSPLLKSGGCWLLQFFGIEACVPS